MRSNVLDQHPSSGIRLMVVWFDMLPGDGRQMTDLRLLAGGHVTNYWDQQHVVGSWFAQNVSGHDLAENGGVAWDAWFLYSPSAHWGSAPVDAGSSVAGTTDRLSAALQPYLG